MDARAMKRQPVKSSAIISIGYDRTSRTLEVEFISGRIYQYYDVPWTVHRDLMLASSQGRYLEQNIRDQYGFTRVA